jgi:hypothetical protein
VADCQLDFLTGTAQGDPRGWSALLSRPAWRLHYTGDLEEDNADGHMHPNPAPEARRGRLPSGCIRIVDARGTV